MSRILVAEDDEIVRITVCDRLAAKGWQVDPAADGREALARIEGHSYDLVITDIRMPGLDGHAVLERLRSASPGTDVIMMTAYGSVDDAVDCLKRGAADYILKPFDLDDLTIRVSRLLSVQAVKARCASLEERCRQPAMIGHSPVMRQLFTLVAQVAASDVTVLVSGESGTGKELVAAAIHAGSPRAAGPYIRINCAAIPEQLMEAELFGHEKGAFTGAHARKAGKFELADKGTLLLDEVGELPLHLQAKLLRVLQEREVERVGGSRPFAVDVRVIAATAKDLAQEVQRGTFRGDLFYRLQVIPITVPPLRDRREDIPELCSLFLAELGARRGRPLTLSRAALDCLQRYSFPGNVRELRNILERASVLAPGPVIQPSDLPADLAGSPAAATMDTVHLATALAAAERSCIRRALAQTQGARAEAARLLGISRKSLWEKMRQHGLEASGPGDESD
ncbi:MAG: sigma-54 dependent transcriptional regulator [Thermodesulfobacteriota bacterium]